MHAMHMAVVARFLHEKLVPLDLRSNTHLIWWLLPDTADLSFQVQRGYPRSCRGIQQGQVNRCSLSCRQP